MAGETGLVGQSLCRILERSDCDLLSAPHDALDLTNQKETYEWLGDHKPDAVYMAAGRVGGIGANAAHPAAFLRDNLSMAHNVIEGAHRAGVDKLLFLGSSCIYPKMAAQPVLEESLLAGPLEETNEAYAIAKIAGVKLCQFYKRQYGRNYISAMPTNLYGPHDRFDPESAHVIPAMILKFHAAVESGAERVVLWGTGAPLREFLHADDLARALIVLMERYDGEAPVNIGSGVEISIRDLALMIKKISGFQGDVVFDSAKPDGTPRKLLDSSKIRAMGWMPEISLKSGLEETFHWYAKHIPLSPSGRGKG